MKKYKRSESELTRLVWSRSVEYDRSLLLEVQAKNPLAFKKAKVGWEDIAETLRNGQPKMKVTDRSCRERVNELLKKYRKEEAVIIRSTGATEDRVTEIKSMLTIINDMALTKPQHSSLYHKKTRTDGESRRDAALNEISGSDTDDDYIHGKYQRGDTTSKHQKSINNGEIEDVTNINDLFNDRPMTLAEEDELMFADYDIEIDLDSQVMDVDVASSVGQNESWRDLPSTSSDHPYSIPIEHLDAQSPTYQPSTPQSSTSRPPTSQPPTSQPPTSQPSTSRSSASQPPTSQPSTSRSSASPPPTSQPPTSQPSTPRSSASPPPTYQPPTSQPSTSRSSASRPPTSQPPTSQPSSSRSSTSSPPRQNTTSNRFSNPKKDLIAYLDKKAEHELFFRKEDIRLREIDMNIKKEEVKARADNKREELRISRIRTEAEAEERKQLLTLLSKLINKEN